MSSLGSMMRNYSGSPGFSKVLRIGSAAVGLLLATAGCRSNRMEPYPRFIGIHDNGVFIPPPVVLVGTVIASGKIGQSHLSPWDGETAYQEYRVSVAVENILRGNAPSPIVNISFMAHLSSGGRRRLGLKSDGGSWQVGDREMFFLQRDSGRLRTVCDNFASNCVLPVQSGRHDSVRPRAQVGEMIAEVFLSKGSGIADSQMARGLDEGASAAFYFAPEFSVSRLEELIWSLPSPVREEACKSLDACSRSGPYQDSDLSSHLRAEPSFRRAMSFCADTKGSVSN